MDFQKFQSNKNTTYYFCVQLLLQLLVLQLLLLLLRQVSHKLMRVDYL